ncbi:MAG: ATP-binding protein [Bryobacteraceae bacterium]|jgi:signal transduction histidine kinase
MTRVDAPAISRWIRPHDLVVWALLAGALIFNAWEIKPLAAFLALAAVQVAEPRIPALNSGRGLAAALLVKIALGYLLIGHTGSLDSSYWIVMALPVISAATALGLVATLAVAVVASGAYLSYILILDPKYYLDAESVYALLVRTVFLIIVGILTNALAEDLRAQRENYRRTAEQLADANRQLREAEEAIRRSERLAALGHLSAGLAHELRNPMGTIRGSAEMLERAVAAENEVAREMAGFIVTETARANSLITRFLQFARPIALRLETGDLSQTLDRAIALAEREAPGVSIYRNYQLDMPAFPFDAELLERVFYNLVLNAAQASPPGGTVTVKTRAAGGIAEVAVIDRGSGIASENRNTIFNPFFTTKPSGVGLGLAIVSKIVDEHGGKITVESEAGKGSVFHVLLPMERPAANQ